MLKAKLNTASGRPMFIFGLSRRNAELLLTGKPIAIELEDLNGPPCTVIITGGENEEVIARDVLTQLVEAGVNMDGAKES